MPLMTLRIVRFFIGLLLLPVCVAVTQAVVSLARLAQAASDSIIPLSAWAFGGGFVLWLIVFLTLPRPVRTYVLAHELTHALWGTLMGEKVLGMRVSAQKGSVTLSGSNFLITLAPYFFPLYTILVIIGYALLALFWEPGDYYLVWLALVGLTWGFHFTFTISSLLQHQTDIKECGHLFSYTIIYLFNILGIGFWIVAVSSPTLEQFVGIIGADTARLAVLMWKQAVFWSVKWRQ
jgi:hypothetical protein